MPMLVIQHRVADFEAWKKAFDADPLGRARNGVVGHAIYRPAGDPLQVVIHLEFSSLERAEAFLPALRAMWTRVGGPIGLGGPDEVKVDVLEETERRAY